MNALTVYEMFRTSHTAYEQRSDNGSAMSRFIMYEMDGRDHVMRLTWDIVGYSLNRYSMIIKGLIIGVVMFEAELWGVPCGIEFPDLFSPFAPSENSFKITKYFRDTVISMAELEHHFVMARLQAFGGDQ